MWHRSEHLSTNNWLTLDYLLGLRGYGLIFYGALPASLGALGAFKPPDQSTLDSKLGLAALPYILCVALIPVILTFVQVRQRLANWYLLPIYLSVRATMITLAIILISSLVSGANGLLVGTYKLVSYATWNALPFISKARPIGECLLLSFAYLVGSSTLFLTVVKEDNNLPLLPCKREVENLTALRGNLREIEKSKVHSQAPIPGQFDQAFDARVVALTQKIGDATPAFKNTENDFTGLGRKKFYAELSAELSDLRAAADDVRLSPANWQYYWTPDGNPLTDAQQKLRAQMNDEQKKWCTQIARLRGLRLND